MSVQVRIHIPRRTCFGQERDLGNCLKLCGTRAEVGELSLCCKIEGLVVESVCGTSHLLFRSPSSLFSCPQKSHERTWFHTHVVISKLVVSDTQACRDSSPWSLCKPHHEKTAKTVYTVVYFIIKNQHNVQVGVRSTLRNCSTFISFCGRLLRMWKKGLDSLHNIFMFLAYVVTWRHDWRVVFQFADPK